MKSLSECFKVKHQNETMRGWDEIPRVSLHKYLSIYGAIYYPICATSHPKVLKNRLVHFAGLIARWSIDEHTFVRAPKEFGQYEGENGAGYEYTFRYNRVANHKEWFKIEKHPFVLLLFPYVTEICVKLLIAINNRSAWPACVELHYSLNCDTFWNFFFGLFYRQKSNSSA